MIMQLLNCDWPAKILAGLNFQAQKNQQMLLDSVCAISTGLAGHKSETTTSVCSFILSKWCKF